MKLTNLTPHPVTIYRDGEPLLTIPPSGAVARVAERRDAEWQIAAGNDPLGPDVLVPVARLRLGERAVTGLPDPDPVRYLPSGSGTDRHDVRPVRDTAYVVSRLVAEALPGRDDLFCPGPEIRDAGGQIIGCAGLYQVGA